MQLPPEIRQMIYALVVVSSEYPVVRAPSPSISQLNSICFLNRLTVKEGLPIFYSSNHFEIENTERGTQWVRSIGDNINDIRKLDLILTLPVCHPRKRYQPFDMLARCHQLALTIYCSLSEVPGLVSHTSRFKNMSNMHGFSSATWAINRPRFFGGIFSHFESAPEYTCQSHRTRLTRACERFESACPDKCPIHNGRERDASKASIHILCQI